MCGGFSKDYLIVKLQLMVTGKIEGNYVLSWICQHALVKPYFIFRVNEVSIFAIPENAFCYMPAEAISTTKNDHEFNSA